MDGHVKKSCPLLSVLDYDIMREINTIEFK